MKLNKWQKTVMTWKPSHEWTTNIPVDDLKECPNHFVRKLQAISIPDSYENDRCAVITCEIVRGIIGPTTRRQEFITKIQSLTKEDKMRFVHASTGRNGTDFKVTLNLKSSFCEEVIDFVRDFRTVLGIEEQSDYNLSAFNIQSTTMYRQGEGWIPYEEYFKMRMRLRVEEFHVEIMPDTKPLS